MGTVPEGNRVQDPETAVGAFHLRREFFAFRRPRRAPVFEHLRSGYCASSALICWATIACTARVGCAPSQKRYSSGLLHVKGGTLGVMHASVTLVSPNSAGSAIMVLTVPYRSKRTISMPERLFSSCVRTSSRFALKAWLSVWAS